MSFEGLHRTCIWFKKVKGGVFRCAEFKEPGQKKYPGKHPSNCPKGGRKLISRSRGLIRLDPRGCAGVSYKPRRRRRSRSGSSRRKMRP